MHALIKHAIKRAISTHPAENGQRVVQARLRVRAAVIPGQLMRVRKLKRAEQQQQSCERQPSSVWGLRLNRGATKISAPITTHLSLRRASSANGDASARTRRGGRVELADGLQNDPGVLEPRPCTRCIACSNKKRRTKAGPCVPFMRAHSAAAFRRSAMMIAPRAPQLQGPLRTLSQQAAGAAL